VYFKGRGWNNGESTGSDVLDSYDICLIQEHCLFHDQLHELNFNPDFLSVGVSGMDSFALHHGRPFGGCAILFRKSLIGSVIMLSTNAKRYCALRLSDQSGQITIILLVCVYLPTDCGNATSCEDFLLALGELKGFICSQSFDSLMIIGDFNFNVNFNRGGMNCAQLLEYYLTAVDLGYRSHINFTYENSDGSVTSWLDHVLTGQSSAYIVLMFQNWILPVIFLIITSFLFCLNSQPAML